MLLYPRKVSYVIRDGLEVVRGGHDHPLGLEKIAKLNVKHPTFIEILKFDTPEGFNLPGTKMLAPPLHII